MNYLRFFILFLAMTLASGLLADDGATDSLLGVISVAKEDTNKVNTLLNLSKSYFGSSPADAIKYGEQARELSEKLNFKNGLAYALKNIGIAYYLQGQYVGALENWNRSLKVFESLNDRVGVANMLSNIGAIYFNQADDVNALDHYLRSLKVSEETGDTLRITTALINIGAVYFNKKATHDKSLEYYLRALPLAEAIKDNDAIGTTTVNLGELYLEKGDDVSALNYLERSAKAYEGSENIPYSLNTIGKVYAMRGDFDKALRYQEQAYNIALGLNAKLDMTQSLIGQASTYEQMGDRKNALAKYEAAKTFAIEVGASYELKNIYEGMSRLYSQLKDFGNAFRYQSLLTEIKDTLYNFEIEKKLSGLAFNFEIEKKQGQIDLLTKDKEIQDLDLKRQRFAKNAFMVGLLLVVVIVFILFRNYRQKVKINKVLDKQKDEIEALLLNILPEEVADELQREGHATPRFYDSVSVLFTDFKDFSKIAEGLSPHDLVEELNEYFNAFDDIIETHNLEKIKTIGDAYMCAGGIPTPDTSHPLNTIKAALDIVEFINMKNEERLTNGLTHWDIRIGIHTGPVVAGVVGKSKYAYDIWGSTVNIASRMESNGKPGKINISNATYMLVKEHYTCSHRGKISAKNIGEVDMYFVESESESSLVTA